MTTHPTGGKREKRFKELAEFFSRGRISARKFCAPPELLFARRFWPSIGGRLVRPSNMPKHGYERREDAIAAAREFKCKSRAALGAKS